MEFSHQYDRLKLIANNSRFLILPHWHRPNLGSKALSLCERRLPGDWRERFGHPLVLLETFVDPERFRGTLYRAANWIELGQTKGFRRTRGGYSETAHAPKRVFVKRLQGDACAVLTRPHLPFPYRTGAPKIRLTADQMMSLPQYIADIPDPRRAQANAQRLLQTNRGHWSIENSCHYILDWNYDEDRCRIRTGHDPANITRLRRFVIGLIKSKGIYSVAQNMRELTRHVRLVFDYLRMSKNSCAPVCL
jgi:hypothetical protein